MGQSLGQVQHVLAIETDRLGMATLKHQKVVILWGWVLVLLLFGVQGWCHRFVLDVAPCQAKRSKSLLFLLDVD